MTTTPNQKNICTECPICVEKFNKSSRKSIMCPHCSTESCADCVKKYLLIHSPNIFPSCLGCNKEWTLDFLASNTPVIFHNKIYREHRAKILVEREKSILHTRQPLVSKEINIREAIKEKEKIQKEIKKFEKHIRTLKQQKFILQRFIDNPNSEIIPEIDRQTFIKSCPVENCRGYLSTQWKCGICNTFTCSDCQIPKKSKEDPEHICNPDTVLTLTLITKESKPCPECNVPTCKIDGCDQMWCVYCKTPWSWKNGRKEHGKIHNPHYYEWMRSQNNGVIPREQGDELHERVPLLRYILSHISLYLGNRNPPIVISYAMRMVVHITQIELQRYPHIINNMDTNADLAISYLLKEITEEVWIKDIKKREKKREKDSEIHQLFDTMKNTLIGLIRSLVRTTSVEEIDIILTQLDSIRLYINSQFLLLSKQFTCVCIQIDDLWISTIIKNK